MHEPKPFASLTSGLLARKGGASPAMRRQVMLGAMPSAAPHDDLGWNDMGEDSARQSDPLIGLTPMGATPASQVPTPIVPEVPVVDEAPVPVVVEQRRALEEQVAVPAPATVAAKQAVAQRGKAAFTLRLDPERHLRLRLACAVGNRSAQQIVTDALDAFLNSQPQIDALAEQLPRPGGKRTKR